MIPDTPQKRLFRVCLLGGGLALALLGYGMYYNAMGQGIPCLLYQFTGLRCAGCGLTRAIAAVVRLDLPEAFAQHALWPVYALYFLGIFLADAAAYVRRGVLRLLPGRWWMHIPVAALLIGYGILRNIL